MNKTTFHSLQETLYEEVLPNGLTLYVLPKAGFHRTYATLSTPLGSTITSVIDNDTETDIPLGIAHFLEHKLFEQNNEDVSERFALNGASVNAFTMNNRTTYLFSCTEQVNKNLEILLDFVFNPLFTEEGIEREKDIIIQEIKMYQDDPNTAIYMGALRNMYHNLSVKEDILGTVDSINTIDKSILELVHRTCYNPAKMVLFVTGNVEPQDILNTVNLYTKDLVNIIPKKCVSTPTEPAHVLHKSNSQEMEIMLPNAVVGFKLTPNNQFSSNIMKQELIYSITMDLLVGKSSKYYQDLLHEQLINDSFGMDITIENDYAFVLVGSHTQKPNELIDRIHTIVTSCIKEGLDQDHFIRTKKQILGGLIQAFNSLEYIANQFTKYHFMNSSLFEVLDVTKSITLDDIETALRSLSDTSIQTSYVIFPKK